MTQMTVEEGRELALSIEMEFIELCHKQREAFMASHDVLEASIRLLSVLDALAMFTHLVLALAEEGQYDRYIERFDHIREHGEKPEHVSTH